MKMNRVLFFLAFFLLASESTVLSAPSCGAVINDLTPCLSFIQGKDASPSCCAGVKALQATAKTKADRVASCNCAKPALAHLNYDPKRIPLLPNQCGVSYNLPPIDKNFDCNKIAM